MLPYKRILFICHANTARSIIAEALLKKMLQEHALEGYLEVQSGGIAAYARDGALVSLDTRFVLRDAGIDLPPGSVSTDLKRNRHLIEAADLILAMTVEQVHMLREGFPEAAGKDVHTLKAFAGEPGDIDDPAGRDEGVFEACRDEIERTLRKAFERIAPKRSTP